MIHIVYPYDNTLDNVEKLAKQLAEECGDKLRILRIEPNPQSKETALKEIGSIPKEDLLIFIGHGTPSGLLGPKGDAVGHPDFHEKEEEFSQESKYNDESFISETNWHILNGRQFVCYACMSAEWLAKARPATGIGFGIIPSSVTEIQRLGFNDATTDDALMVVNIMDSIMYDAIIHIIRYGFEPCRFLDFVGLQIHFHIACLMHETREHKCVIKALFKIKDEIRLIVLK